MKKLFLIILIAATSACREPKETPKDILSKSDMTKILIEKHIVETSAASEGLPSDSAKALYDALLRNIFAKYKIDTATYNRSFRYYTNNVEEMDQIYGAVVDSLSLREATGNMD